MEILNWLQNWYKNQTNGDWEHSFGIKIYTVDNPGWRIIIDLKETSLESLEMDYQTTDASETDWFDYAIKDNKFQAAGDPSKLAFLLNKFKEIAEYHELLNKS